MAPASRYHRCRLQLCFNKMRNRYLLVSILALLCSVAFAASTIAAEGPVEEHAGAPLRPAPVYKVGKLANPTAMLVTWVVAAGNLVGAKLERRKIKPIPSGLQNFWEL